MRRIWALFFFLLLLAVNACDGTDRTLSVITGETCATPNGAVLLEVITSLHDYQIEWTALDGGSFHRTDVHLVVWMAPSTSGVYRVEAQVIGDFYTDSVTHSIQVVDEPGLKILDMGLIVTQGIKKAIIAFKNDDLQERDIIDFSFYMLLWDGEDYQGNLLSYLGQTMYRGRPNRYDLLPVRYGELYDGDEWDLRWAGETASILPWVYQIHYHNDQVWNLYEQD